LADDVATGVVFFGGGVAEIIKVTDWRAVTSKSGWEEPWMLGFQTNRPWPLLSIKSTLAPFIGGGDFTGGAVVGITGLVGGESAGAGGVHRMPERLSRRSNTGGAIGGKMAESALGCQGFE
jgi:hypothetical protein